MLAPHVTKPKQSAPQIQAGAHIAAKPLPLPHSTGQGWDFSIIPVQSKRDDQLEREADRTADEVLVMPRPAPAATAAYSSGGRGNALSAPARDLFEPRFGRDFGNVRVHDGPDAARSAAALGARAFTLGRNIVFGVGQYAPSSRVGQHLLAHELAHTVQQSRGPKALQRSPLSDAVKADWAKDPKLESLLQRLGQADVQNTQSDGDVDALIDTLLSNPNDNWVAHQIRHGKLGDTTGAGGPKVKGKPVMRPVKAIFFKGLTDRRALVIAGVHGTETQGMEVADRLIADLSKPGNPPPMLSVIIVPRIFPDNDTAFSREGVGAHPNRNFPDPSKSLEDSKDKEGAPRSAPSGGSQKILPENVMLIELMEQFHPERIISIHGTWGPGSAGVFYDPISVTPEQRRSAGELSKGLDGGQELSPKLQEELERDHLRALQAGVDQTNQTDQDLSIEAAKRIDADTAGITKSVPAKGGGTTSVDPRAGRRMGRDTDKGVLKSTDRQARLAHASVAGNVGETGAIDTAFWSANTPGGVSLGDYASKRGISIFTVEPPVDAESSLYPDKIDPAHPGGTDRAVGVIDKLTKADRITELQAYADAVRTILLGR